MNINDKILDEDLYAMFTQSKQWAESLSEVRAVNEAIADALNHHGIGTSLTDEGEYDFESGQLLEDLPREIRELDEMELAYPLICGLAAQFALFVKEALHEPKYI